MKRTRIIASALSLIAFSLCAWPIFELLKEDGNLVEASLNLVYFFTLLIAFLCFRISLSYSNKINPVITLLSIAVIITSTYVWVYSPELLVTGEITLGIIPLLIGTTLMLVVKTNSKWSKLPQALIGIIAVTLATCVFLGVSSAFVYYAVMIGLVISTLGTLTFLIFGKTN